MVPHAIAATAIIPSCAAARRDRTAAVVAGLEASGAPATQSSICVNEGEPLFFDTSTTSSFFTCHAGAIEQNRVACDGDYQLCETRARELAPTSFRSCSLRLNTAIDDRLAVSYGHGGRDGP